MRTADVQRNTAETQIYVKIGLDGTGARELDSGIPFLDHMLDQIARHGLVDLTIRARATLKLMPTTPWKTSASRWAKPFPRPSGTSRVSFVMATLMFRWMRPSRAWWWIFPAGLAWSSIASWKRQFVGQFDLDLIHEFFQGFVNHAQVTLHFDNLKGENAHHQCETLFKAFGRALRMAVALDPRLDANAIPSTKGSL